MQLSDLDYVLPPELIAQVPLERRDASRMLVVDRSRSEFEDHMFSELPGFLRAGDVLVLNNTKVFPARLIGKTETGAAVEVFLISEVDGRTGTWRALARPLKRLRLGKRIFFNEAAACEVIDITGEGQVQVQFKNKSEDFYEVLEAIGKTPLPPYIFRDNDQSSSNDRERYQTVYASSTGAIAAPTAGLHFTPTFLDSLRDQDVLITEITLHVGYGTFEPVRVKDLAEHRVLPENYRISQETAELLNEAKGVARRIVAVGTTTSRALEHSISANGKFVSGSAIADLTVTPGYQFSAVNALLTNFHLPKSSLLILVSTFAGRELIMRAYEHAVAERYRFYSYGDCMFIA